LAHAAASHRSTAATRRAQARRQAKQDAALRHVVTQNAGCLSQLAPTQARTLALRSGLGGQRPDSAVQVAHILGVSAAREQTIERGALAQLRTDAQGGCGAAPSPMSVAAMEFVAAHNGTLVASLAPAPASLVAGGGTVAAPGSSATSSQGAAAGANTSSSQGRSSSGSSGHGGALPQGPAIRAASISSGSQAGLGSEVAILVLIALVALAVPFLINTMRHRRSMAGGGGAAAARVAPERSAAPADVMAPAAAPAASQAASVWVPAAAAAESAPAAPEESSAPQEPVPADGPAAAEETPAPASASASASASPAMPAKPTATPAAPNPAAPTPTVAKRRPREPTWLREHGSQAAMVAAGIGGVVRLLLRGRRR
jgi:hypothetical protein